MADINVLKIGSGDISKIRDGQTAGLISGVVKLAAKGIKVILGGIAVTIGEDDKTADTERTFIKNALNGCQNKAQLATTLTALNAALENKGNNATYNIDNVLKALKEKGLTLEQINGLNGKTGDALIEALLSTLGQKPEENKLASKDNGDATLDSIIQDDQNKKGKSPVPGATSEAEVKSSQFAIPLENKIYRFLINWVGKDKEAELRNDLKDGKLNWTEAEALGMTKEAFNLLSVGGDASKVNKHGAVAGDQSITEEDVEYFKYVIADIANATGQPETVINAYLTADKFTLVNKGDAVKTFNRSDLKGASFSTLLSAVDPYLQSTAKMILSNLKISESDGKAISNDKLGVFFITLSFLGQLKEEDAGKILPGAGVIGKPSSAKLDDIFVWVFGENAKKMNLVKGEKVKGKEENTSSAAKSNETTGKIEIPGQKEFESATEVDGTLKSSLTPIQYQAEISKYVQAMETRYSELMPKAKDKTINGSEKREFIILTAGLIAYEKLLLDPRVKDKAMFAIENKDLFGYDIVKGLVTNCINTLYRYKTKENLQAAQGIMEAFEKIATNKQEIPDNITPPPTGKSDETQFMTAAKITEEYKKQYPTGATRTNIDTVTEYLGAYLDGFDTETSLTVDQKLSGAVTLISLVNPYLTDKTMISNIEKALKVGKINYKNTPDGVKDGFYLLLDQLCKGTVKK